MAVTTAGTEGRLRACVFLSCLVRRAWMRWGNSWLFQVAWRSPLRGGWADSERNGLLLCRVPVCHGCKRWLTTVRTVERIEF